MLTRRSFLAASAALLPAAEQPLNVVLILVDDFGATDVACYGSRFYETPNMDRLAAEGMRFTEAYSACTVCSPSRAAIMTGKYPARLHLTDWIPGHNRPFAKLLPPAWRKHLPLEETTLAEVLKPKGYATASIGKWHLTPVENPPPYYPDKQGFDLNVGGTHRGSPPSYFSPYKIETLKDGPAGEYLTDREGDEAIRFVQANKSKPWFLYMPHYGVHTPLQAKQELIEKYKRKAKPDAPQRNPVYAAMIESVDQNLGRLMAALKETGQLDRTVIILTGDNGGHLPSTQTNLGIRAGKGSAYEGGVRVPLLVRWPGVVKAGVTSAVPVIGCDLFPTVVEIANAKAPAVDGRSIVPLLRAGGSAGAWNRDTLYWHYPHYHPGGATPYSAVREGDWKLIEFQEDGHAELYNLKADPEEKRDLAASEPARAKKLRSKLHAWRKSVNAQMAEQNPDHDPARAGERGPAQRRD